MTKRCFALFDTPVGRCGIAWGDGRIAMLRLPEADDATMRIRIGKHFPDAEEAAPNELARQAIAAIAALLAGDAADLESIPLDMRDVPPFHRRVYEAARAIPPGTTVSYGEVARRLEAPRAARAVGQALGHNPFAIIVPCHRIVASSGKLGGFTATGGLATKLRLLALEGAPGAADPDDPFAAVRGKSARHRPATSGR
jgi:methylated-DNA-[protein]-cysteine S-methyltransferase